MTHESAPSWGMILTMFLVMFGPIKIIGPFAELTAKRTRGEAQRLALEGVGIACAGGGIAAIVGQRILESWGIALSSLYLSAGAVLLIVALRTTLASYGASRRDIELPEVMLNPALSPLAFPVILTPYGLATFILILAMEGLKQDVMIFGIFLLVMALNLVAMLCAHLIMRRGAGILVLFGSVLSVLQVAFAVQIILDALRFLGIIARL